MTSPRPLRPGAALIAVPIVGLLLDRVVLDDGLLPGTVLRGAIVGALYAMSAAGIVLVWRGSGIINFAQAELGAVAAVLAIEFVVQWDMNYFAALGLGLLIAAGMGWLVSATVIRRLEDAPRLIVTVATIGLAQVFAGVAVIIPFHVFSGLGSARFTTPLDASFELSSITFDGNAVFVLAAVPLLLGGLAWFLRATDYGVAIRATAANQDRARLLGVPTRRVSGLVWALAATLSAATVILRVPLFGFTAFGNVSGGGNALLLRVLAAAVIGRMTSLPRTIAAAVAIGVIEEVASSEIGNTNVVDGLLVVVILVALLTQRDAFSRAAETGIASWQTTREVRSIPEELRRLPEVAWASRFLKGGVLAVAVVLPAWAGASQEQAAALLCIYAIVALSLLILTGWAGQVSLGQFALVGIGGAVSGTLYATHGWDFLLASLMGVVAAALMAAVVGVPALRVRGPFLAVATLAMAVTTSTYLLNDRYFGWLVPRDVEPPVLWDRIDLGARWVQYEACLVVLLIAMAAARNLRASPIGRMVVAVRDNQPASESVGVPGTRTKLVAFALSGAFAGLAGSLYAVIQGGVFADAFNADVSVKLFSTAVIGGFTIAGAVLGAVYVRGAEFFLPNEWSLVASGIGILLLLLVLPDGLGGAMYRIRDVLLRRLARRRDLLVPSLLEDRGAMSERVESAMVRRRPVRQVRGRTVLLSLAGVDVAYGQTQVLFGVDLHVYEGEILALLGTNGAGKSTVLRAVSGLARVSGGVVHLDGEEITGSDPLATTAMGIAHVPGGRGVFPDLTVAENLRIARWTHRRGRGDDGSLSQCLDWFPALERRWETRAGDLSGGEQQMLSLAQAFLAEPRLLLIDELSLGLAPTIIEQLLGIVQEINRRGTTVVLVEQSVTTALRVAERAVFMEKGEVRFDGSTSELVERGDLVRAVYLQGTRGAGRTLPRPDERERRQMGAGRSALRVEGLTRSYGGITAVDHVSLELAQGEILGVIGPNGAGKTTLFDLITGLTPSDAGSVILGGTDVTERPAYVRAQLGLGRTFQDARLWPSLSVRECLTLASQPDRRGADPISALFRLPALRSDEAVSTAAADELIELLGVTAFADKFVGELSTGSRRMVEIGCIIASGATTILLDEPSSGIAQREAEALGPVIVDLRRELDASILVIEHDMQLLAAVVDRLVALDTGVLVTQGSPQEVLEHPQVVAAYLGDRFDTPPRPVVPRGAR